MKSIIKKVSYSIIGLLLLYSLLGFWVLPKVLSSQLPTLAKEHLNRDLEFDDLQFNPFSMELELKGFKVKKIDVNSFFNFQRLYINIAVLKSIADLSLTIDQILLEQPNLFVIRDQNGDLNFKDVLLLLESKDQEESSEDPFPVTILKIAISEGKLAWRDDFYANAQQEDIYPINLSVDNFTTQANKQSHLDIIISTSSGGQLEWQGELELLPFRSYGHIKLDKVDFHRIWELFLQDDVNFELLSGTEIIEGDYQLDSTADGMQLIINNALVAINNFQLAEKGSTDPLISIPNFKISGIAIDLLKKDIAIAEISAKDARFKAWLNTDGRINYQSLFSPDIESEPAIQQSPSAIEAAEEPWKISVNKLAMNDFALDFTDKTLQTPVHINLTSLNLNISDLTTDPSAQLPFELGLTINDGGHLKLQGQATLEPFSAEIQVDASNIAINDFQPYIDPFLRLEFSSGLVNVNAKVSMIDAASTQENADQSLAIHIQGDSSVTDFVTIDKVSKKEFLKWQKLSLQQMDLDLSANSYNIEKVTIERPYTRILIRKDQTINVNDIVIDNPETETQPPEQQQEIAEKTPTLSYKINSIEMIDGEADFSDLALILPFTTHINQLKGSVKGVSSEQNSVIHVALTGKAHDLAPVNIKGTVNPDQGDSAIELDFLSMPLPLMTPYMAEFAGYKVEKGNMSLSLKYTLKNNQFTASNSLLIDQLVLGEEVENPNAVSLPLGLAIALLEDSDGKIKLDVPITGSLDDPEFSIASIVVDALVNVITKVVTSPFNALASLIDSDADVSKIIFTPGQATLSNEEQTKLDDLANALTQKMVLKLEIKGTAFSNHDWPALQAEALDKQLINIRADNLSEEPEQVTLSEGEYQDLLADLFIQTFPQLAERSFLGTPKLLDPEAGDFYSIAKIKLAAIIPTDRSRLQKLAAARAKAIARYLVAKEISIERIYLLDVAIDPEQTDEKIVSPLSLTAN